MTDTRTDAQPAADNREGVEALQKLRGQHETLGMRLAGEEFAAAASIVRQAIGADAAEVLLEKRVDACSGDITMEVLVVLDRDRKPLWFNMESRHCCWDYPGAEAVSDEVGWPKVQVERAVVYTIDDQIERGYTAVDGTSGPLEWAENDFFKNVDALLVLDVEAAINGEAAGGALADGLTPAEIEVALVALAELYDNSGDDTGEYLSVPQQEIAERVRCLWLARDAD